MICQRVLEILKGILEEVGIGVSTDEISFLVEKGLIATVTQNEFHQKSQEAENLVAREQELSDAETLQEGFKKNAAGLQRKINSKWHEFWSSEETIAGEKRQLKSCEEEIQKNQNKIDQLRAEISRLKEIQDMLDGCVRLGEEYAILQEKGHQTLLFLESSVSKTKNRPYEEFERAQELLESAIKSRRKRFLEMFKYLCSLGFGSSAKVVQLALSLSGLEGTVEEVWERARVINDFLYKHGWESYDRLRIVSAVAAQPGDINKLRDELAEIFNLMIKDGHSKCYGTWSEAAAIMKIPFGNASEKYQRYEKMRNALAKREWRKGSAASCIIAANLSQRNGEVEDIAEEFRTLEKKLVERGRRDCTKSGIASLILMGMKGTLDEKADRFTEVFQAMKVRGWDGTDDYPAAGVLSLTPGTAEENVLRLAQTRKWLKGEGFSKDLTMRSAMLVAGCFRDFMKQYLSSPDALEGLRDSCEADLGAGGNPLLAAAVVMMLDGNPLIAGLAAMASGSTFIGIMAGMTLSPDISQVDTLPSLDGGAELPSFDITEQPPLDLNILEDMNLNLDTFPDMGIDTDVLSGASDLEIASDSILDDIGGGLFGD